jgi:SAM-dependent methyltransferase
VRSFFSDEFWPKIVAQAEHLIALAEAEPPATILDLACGAGSASIALAQLGFSVVGVDCTPAMLEVAREMAAAKGVKAQWILGDMREIAYEDEFDYVFLRDVIFGVFDTEQEDHDLVRRIAAALRTGGRCLFEVYNKEFALGHGVENAFFYDADLGRFAARAGGPAWAAGASVRLYSPHEWERMLASNHLEIVKRDGWHWNGDPDPPPWRADFIVAQKMSMPP